MTRARSTGVRAARVPRRLLATAIALACACPLAQADETTTDLDRVQVIGSHIRKAAQEGRAQTWVIQRDEIERTGLTSVGEVLQDLTSGGKALGSQFNSSGNFGAPPDGGGIGAGSAQVDLRHLESKRVLVLVDGKRWVNESSASGVGGAVDLNTIPLAIVQRIEVLPSGASALYGSDAIAGVINLVTRADFSGADVLVSQGQFEQGDGETSRVELTVGGQAGRFSGVLSVGYNDQQRVSSDDREQTRTQPAGSSRGSPVTPQGRAIFVPTFATPPGLCPPTVDVNGDGVPDVPLCDLTTPTNAPVGAGGTPVFPGGFVRYTPEQSFNAQPYNLALTPNRRKHVFASGRFDITEGVSAYARLLYNERDSLNQAAANTLVIGPEAPGNGIADTTGVSRLNPYNPFGVDLVPGANMFAVARRPLEGGPRIFRQAVDTRYLSAGLEGSLQAWGGRTFFWDANLISTRSQARQQFQNAYNLQRIKTALGDPAVCAQTPGCVPLNLFGGMGADGQGTITPAMLGWIRTEVHDRSDQQMDAFSATLSGDLFALPGGTAGFAAGVEHREYQGSMIPDAQRISGQVFDQSANSVVRGSYHVDEVFLEASLPLTRQWELSAAARYSDYSLSGSVVTAHAGFSWRPSDQFLLRGGWGQGFRAPFIGELFGLSQFGAVIVDPCSGYAGSGNATLIANCQALGVPASYRQLSSQVFTTTGGNPRLDPERSRSYTLGMVYSPAWAQARAAADRLDLEVNYFHYQVRDAIAAPDAQDVLDACVASADAQSTHCRGITRAATGTISAFDNRLSNIGRITTDGADVRVGWSLETGVGRFDVDWQSTYTHSYQATDAFGNRFSRTVGVEVNDSAIPRWQSNLDAGWMRGDWELHWKLRFIARVSEACSDAFDNDPARSLQALGLCSDPNPQQPALSRNTLGGTTYHDLSAAWRDAFGMQGLRVTAGANNAFGKSPPVCFTCSLNGYDAGTYDLPGRFFFVQAAYRY